MNKAESKKTALASVEREEIPRPHEKKAAPVTKKQFKEPKHHHAQHKKVKLSKK